MDQPEKSALTDIQAANRRLSATLVADARLASLMALLTSAAVAMVYLLTRFGLLGTTSPQLLTAAGAILFIVAGFTVASGLAQRQRGITGQIVAITTLAIFAIFMTTLWQGIALVLILIVWAQTASAFISGYPRPMAASPIVISILTTLIILGLESSLDHPRLQSNTLPTIASLGFFLSTAVLYFATILINNSPRFRSLQGRLLLTSVAIVTTPLIAMSVILGLNGYNSTREQINNSLLAIVNLKERQIDQLVLSYQEDILRAERDFELNRSIRFLLLNPGQVSVEANLNRAVALSHLHAIRASEAGAYKDIWVLDSQGSIVLSTSLNAVGENYSSMMFFQQGRTDFAMDIPVDAPFSKNEIIISSPIFSPNQELIGVLVLRADILPLKNIMETAPGLPEASTYLLGLDFLPITATPGSVEEAERQAIRTAIMSGVQSENGIYNTYPSFSGETSLGYFRWYEPMQVMLVAEVPQAVVFQSLLSSIAASVLTGLFGMAIAFVAVMISSRSISDPVQRLEHSAQRFANGELATRAETDRRDEIGSLSRSFNVMADRLQDTIGSLEQRVLARTQELELQTLRLRTAAEIARDAASARDLDDLINRSARLIQDRFEFDHTGIFLLDQDNEYAVLRASSSEAGKAMMANQHKLKVGEVGIVGYVASTAKPRIALDTGQDAAFFDNPFLPDTRSEMALPLVADNVIIGVLDVQSNKPQAFSEEDIAIMQVMADQLATAIEKTRLLNELQENLRELERTSQKVTLEGWKEIGGQKGMIGYHYDRTKLEAASDISELARNALQTGSIAYSNHAGSEEGQMKSAAIPVKLRGQTIGVVNVQFRGDKVPEETVHLIEVTADRLAIAVENARLVQESQRRASLEYTISQMSNKIGAATEIDAVLKSTAQELGKLLADTEVTVQLIKSDGAAPEGDRE